MAGILEAVKRPVTDWANAALAFVYPEVCQLCGRERAGPKEGYVCDNCAKEVEYIKAPMCQRCGRPVEGEVLQAFECGNCRGAEMHFIYARSAARATGKVLQAIHAYKYNGHLWLEPFLAGLLIERSQPALTCERWDIVVPVPLHRSKQRQRGFNQAQNLAKRLSQATGMPMRKDLVQRIKATPTQTRLRRAERLENMRGAFRSVPGQLSGQRVVLVDDVFTTGATTSACARALLKAGAGEVCVWTVARGILILSS